MTQDLSQANYMKLQLHEGQTVNSSANSFVQGLGVSAYIHDIACEDLIAMK